jgi:hypothetical protein
MQGHLSALVDNRLIDFRRQIGAAQQHDLTATLTLVTIGAGLRDNRLGYSLMLFRHVLFTIASFITYFYVVISEARLPRSRHADYVDYREGGGTGKRTLPLHAQFPYRHFFVSCRPA